jgi:hypothetical protein
MFPLLKHPQNMTAHASTVPESLRRHVYLAGNPNTHTLERPHHPAEQNNAKHDANENLIQMPPSLVAEEEYLP